MTSQAIAISITEILANEIVFQSRDEITIYGFRHSNGSYVPCEFVISREHFNILLSQNDKTGIEILWKAEQLFVQAHSHQPEINLIDLFGMTQPLKAAGIEIEMGEYEDGMGDTELWFVKSVATLEGARQTR